MLVKEFLAKVSPRMAVTVWDLDMEPGKNKKEDEAGALALAHHFDYNVHVVDFIISENNIILYVKRQ